MAGLTVDVVFETDLIGDAVAEVLHIHEALGRRHGDRFRQLERRIEALADGEIGTLGMIDLEPCRFVVTPPASLSSIIADARALGVI